MFNKAEFFNYLTSRNPHEPEFLQAVEEVVTSLQDFLNANPKYVKHKIIERVTEPERMIMFRVPWVDDKGSININRGYRVQFSSALGPYKGGLRFDKSVTLSVLKFLGFEQIFKNSLTGLPMGGGKGGSDFDPHNKSDEEVMRFCQAFMSELFRHIGPNLDVPAGDMGVGGREIGYLFGQYKKLQNEFGGVLTGKGLEWGGSNIRTEATGYGILYFTEEMLNAKEDSINGKTVLISGSGNVAQFAVEKAIQLGAKVITMSDSDGLIYDKSGIDQEKLNFVMKLKNEKRGRIKEYVSKFKGAKYIKGANPWGLKADVAIPCACENEIQLKDAKSLVKNGVKTVCEGANMPSTNESVKYFLESKVTFSPGKASNAGGVAVSGLEMSQNSIRQSWSREEVDQKLKLIMQSIHNKAYEYGKEKGGFINYVKGANIAGFKKVADAMLAQGLV